jgi:hypothetical protein
MFARNSVSRKRPISLHFNVSGGAAGRLGEAGVVVLRAVVEVEGGDSTLADETVVNEEIWFTAVCRSASLPLDEKEQ